MPEHIIVGGSLGAGFDLEPGLTFEEWLEAVGLDRDVGVLGFTGGSVQNKQALAQGFLAYQALSGQFGVPDAPPESPNISLRIDSQRTGAGDLRINRPVEVR